MKAIASMALAFCRVTKRMYTSLCLRYKKDTEPSSRTGVSAAADSAPRTFSTWVLKADGRVRLQCRTRSDYVRITTRMLEQQATTQGRGRYACQVAPTLDALDVIAVDALDEDVATQVEKVDGGEHGAGQRSSQSIQDRILSTTLSVRCMLHLGPVLPQLSRCQST